jgi:hypothetical protein
MTTIRPRTDRPAIYCSSEWHLRDNPRAFMMYSLALRLTEGGKNDFFLSQPQLAQYFGWDVKTVRAAFRALLKSGLFKLLRGGRGGNGQANFANVYSVLTHSALSRTGQHPCWALPESGTLTYEDAGAKGEETDQKSGRGKVGRCDLPETGRNPLPETGTLVSDESANKFTNPSQSAGLKPASPNQDQPVAERRIITALPSFNVNPNTNPVPQELPEDFRPDQSNERYAKKNGLDLEEELAAFGDLHRSIGNERKNWQAVFRKHLINAAFFRGHISLPDWVPEKEWKAYLAMRERIRRGTTQRGEELVVESLAKLREKGQNVAVVLNQSTQNEWTGLFEVGTGPRGKRVPTTPTGSLTANYADMVEKCEAISKAAIAAEAARKASRDSASGQPA